MSSYYTSIHFFISLAVFLPFIMLVCNRKYIWPNILSKIIGIFMIADAISWFAFNIVGELKYDTIILANIFTVFAFFIVSLFFIEAFNLKSKRNFKIILGALTIVFGLTLFFYKNEMYNNIGSTFSSIVFISGAIIYFVKLMRESKIVNLFSLPSFWYNFAILVNYSCSIFIRLFSNYSLTMSIQSQKTFWLLHSILNLIVYTIVTIGFMKSKTYHTKNV